MSLILAFWRQRQADLSSRPERSTERAEFQNSQAVTEKTCLKKLLLLMITVLKLIKKRAYFYQFANSTKSNIN